MDRWIMLVEIGKQFSCIWEMRQEFGIIGKEEQVSFLSLKYRAEVSIDRIVGRRDAQQAAWSERNSREWDV